MGILKRLAEVEGRIARAAARAGRKPVDVRILFATKYAAAEQLAELAALRPALLIGENRVQDAGEKFAALEEIIGREKSSKIEKHMIGTLQSNKAKRAVELFGCIQSVDSLSLAEKISRHASQAGKEIRIFIEVNNGEEKKRGVPQSELSALVAFAKKLPNIRLAGLMGMGIEGDESATRAFYRSLRKQASQRNLLCSMGMSNDFEIAVEEGADMVRIGSAVFKD
jgi:PLP dependent protein